MFKGDSTIEEYCRCLTSGFCEKHLQEFGKVADADEGQLLQRKALIYMRLHLLNPFLYGKSYSLKCMQDLASKCSIFPKEGFYSEKNFTPGLRESIILFDSVMTYTLCYLSKVCCTAGLFMEARQDYRQENGFTSFLQKLIAARKLSSDEINTFFKTLKKNFENFDVELVKEANLMTLLYVRELRSVKLSTALRQLEKNLLEQPAGENFKRIGIEEYNNENYKDSINAYNSALLIDPYNFVILSKRAQSYLKLKKYEEAELDSRASITICPSWDKGYCNLVSSLLYQECFDDAHLISLFGIQNCEYFPSKSLDTLKCLAKECLSKVQEKCLDQLEFNDENLESYVYSNDQSTIESDSRGQVNDIPDLTDSSSGESDTDEVVKEVKVKQVLKLNKEKNVEIQQNTLESSKLPEITPKEKTNGMQQKTLIPNEKLEITPKEQTIETNQKKPLSNKVLEETPKEKNIETNQMKPLSNKLPEETPKEKHIETNQMKPLSNKLPEETSKEKHIETNQMKPLSNKLPEETSKEKNIEKTVPEVTTKPSKLPEQQTKENINSKTVPEVTTKPSKLPEQQTKENINSVSFEKRIDTSLKEAFAAFSTGSGQLAMNGYLTVLNDIKKSPLQKYDEPYIVNFKYVYGSSCISSGTFEDLQKSINTFKEIIEEHSNVTFPAAYYGLGLAYCKLNRFKDAAVYLDKVHSFLQKGILFKTFNWPGTVTVIEETKPNVLKLKVEELRNICVNPPEPNAICRYESCLFNPPIYYTDPDFKGFMKILCSDQCKLQYHPACWKTFKSTKYLSDKEYLDQSCLTPDCLGTVIKVECIGKDGNSEKIFLSEEWDKGKKAVKQKKSKLEKKLDKNEQRRRKRQTSITLSCSKSDTPEATNERESITDESLADLGFEISDQPATVEITKESQVVENVSSELSVNAEPFMIIKKNIADKEENMQKTFKQKDRKKGGSKKTKLSIDEFCAGEISYYNEYQTRLNKLQESKQFAERGSVQWANLCETEKIPDLDPSRPFYIPECLRDDRYTLETVLQSVNNSSENDVTRSIKESLYQYFEGILSYKGPLKLNDPQLTKEFDDFPNEAKTVINENGGFKSFMLKSMRFAIVKDYVCTITDVIKAYDMPSDYQLDQTFGNADELDYFASDTAYEENEFDDHLSDSFSHLNPHASEYKPLQQQSQNKNRSEHNSDDSNSLLSVVNQLRQPINQALPKFTGPVEKDEKKTVGASYSKCHIKNECQSSTILKKEDTFNRATSVWDMPCSFNDKHTMLNMLNEIVKWFFSDKVAQEDRKQINCDIKPYALIKVPQKQNKCIQGILPEVEMVSIGVMKEDDELNNVVELNKYLEIENRELIEHKLQLEEKLTHSLDSATKNQKKIIVDNSLLKKELEDIKLELENKKIDRAQLEIEQKHVQQLLNKSLEELKSHKKEVEKAKAENERYKFRVKELEDQLTIAKAEKESLSTHKSESKEAAENIKVLLHKMEQRARNAEVGMLKIRRDEFFKNVENKISEAQKKTKEVQAGLTSLGPNLEPYITSSITALLLKIHDYIRNFREIQKGFGLMLDNQIEKIQNGASLSDFKPIVVPDLPEIPSFSDEIVHRMRMPSFPTAATPNSTVNNCGPSSAIQNQMIKGMYYPPNNNQNSLLGSPLITPTPPLITSPPPLITPPPPLITPTLPSIASRLFPTTFPSTNQPGLVNIPPNKYPSPNPSSLCVSGLSTIYPLPVPDTTKQSKLTSYMDPKSATRSASASPISKSSPDDSTGKSFDAASSSSSETKNETGKDLQFEDLPLRTLKDTPSASSDGSETSKISSSNIANNTQIELGYSGAKNIALQKMTNKNSEKLGSAMSLSSQKQDSYNSYAKLRSKLQNRFPQFSLNQLMNYITKIREQNNNKLSGLSMEIIIKKVEELIIKDDENPIQYKAKSRPSVLINKNLVSTPVEEKRPQLQKSQGANPWATSHVNNTLQWSGESADKTCIICYEDMSAKTGPKSAYRVDCGHKFHQKCIKTWLDKNSNCPTCRQHVLLPDDYPSLA